MTLPSDISGLKFWLKADALALNDGDAVGSWTDSSGLSNHFTQGTAGNKPTFKTNIVNGLPIVRFDGGDYLTGPDVMASATSGEIFIVVKLDADPPASAVTGLWDFGSVTGVNGGGHYPYSDGVIYEEFGTTLRKTVGNPTPSLALWRTYNVSTASGAWTARLDNAQLFTTASNTVGWNTAPTLGRSTYSGAEHYYLDGDVAEVFAFNRVLTAAERNELGGYLAGRYGLTISGAINGHARSVVVAATGAIASSGTFLSIFERSASLTASASVEASGTFFTTLERAAALDTTAAVGSAGLLVHVRSAALGAIAGIASAPQRDLLRAAALDATGAIASAGQRDLLRSVALGALAGIASAPQRDLLRVVVLAATADINAAGQVEDGIVEHERTAGFSATVAITADGHGILERAVAFGAMAAIASSATFWSILERAVALSATATIESSGLSWTLLERVVSLSATGEIATAGQRDLLRTASLVAVGAIDAAGQRDLHRAAVLTAIAQITASGVNPTAWTYNGGPPASYDGTAGFNYDGVSAATYGGTANFTYDHDEDWTYEPVTG